MMKGALHDVVPPGRPNRWRSPAFEPLHHMTGEEPRVLFLHYWGIGRTEDLAKGLRSALDQTRRDARGPK